MVMKAPQDGSRAISSPWRLNLVLPALMASVTDLNYTVHTESTGLMSLLNSSKHPQDPEAARPLKIPAIPW